MIVPLRQKVHPQQGGYRTALFALRKQTDSNFRLFHYLLSKEMKNSHGILCVLLLCTITVTVTAQQSPLIGQRTITVLGAAASSIKPDEAVIVFGIETENEDDINQARYQNDTTVTAVLSLIRRLGIPDSAVQTGYLHVERRFHKGDFRD